MFLLSGRVTHWERCIEQAVIDMIDFDRSCDLNLRAMATGRSLQPVPHDAAVQARQVQTPPMRWGFQWPGLIMDLNRQGTDYDPKGWVPQAEVPTPDRFKAHLERPRGGK